MICSAAVAVLSLSLSGVPAFAAAGADEGRTFAADAVVATSPLPGDVDSSLPPVQIRDPTRRPGVLLALYVSQAGLQAFDAYSTAQGLALGARETNLLMRGVVGNPVALWGVKAATAAVSMLLAERMWRSNNHAGAIVVMVVANSIAATVAANNAYMYSVNSDSSVQLNKEQQDEDSESSSERLPAGRSAVNWFQSNQPSFAGTIANPLDIEGGGVMARDLSEMSEKELIRRCESLNRDGYGRTIEHFKGVARRS